MTNLVFFTRRWNRDSSIDSICTKCYRTIASANREDELAIRGKTTSATPTNKSSGRTPILTRQPGEALTKTTSKRTDCQSAVRVKARDRQTVGMTPHTRDCPLSPKLTFLTPFQADRRTESGPARQGPAKPPDPRRYCRLSRLAAHRTAHLQSRFTLSGLGRYQRRHLMPSPSNDDDVLAADRTGILKSLVVVCRAGDRGEQNSNYATRCLKFADRSRFGDLTPATHANWCSSSSYFARSISTFLWAAIFLLMPYHGEERAFIYSLSSAS